MKVLYVLFLLETLNMAMFIPVFSAFVTSVGGTPFILGIINSSNALVTLLWNPIVGSLSDQIGRKGLLIKCMVASCVGSLILCASSSSLILVFIARLIGALGNPVTILLRSTVGDIFKTDEEKKLFFNKCAPIISLAFLMGSLSSGFLSEAKNGYLLSFLLMAITAAISTMVARMGLADDDRITNQTKENISIASKATQELKTAALNIKTISWPRYQKLFIMRGLYEFSLIMIFSNIGLVLLKDFKMEGRSLGYVFFMISIFSIISDLVKLKLKDTLAGIPDYLKIIRVGIVLSVSFIGMALSSSVHLLILLIGIMCFSTTLMAGFWLEMITTKTGKDDRGKVLSAFENLYPLMAIIAPLLSGLVAEIYGERVLIGSAAIPIALIILIAYNQKNKIS